MVAVIPLSQQFVALCMFFKVLGVELNYCNFVYD
jgi:hypothetical protein